MASAVVRRSKGPAGGYRLEAADAANLLTIDMRLDPATSTHNTQLSYRFNPAVLPKDAVPVLALCNALASGDKMAIATLDGQVLAIGTVPFNSVNWPAGDSYLRCAEQLAGIQERAGAFFPLPTGFEPDDQIWMDYAEKLLCGEEVQITWDGATAQCDHDQVGFLLEGIAQTGEVLTLFRADQETLEFAHGKLPLGAITGIAHSARIENLGRRRGPLASAAWRIWQVSWSQELPAVEPHMMHVAAVRRGELPGLHRRPDRSRARRRARRGATSA